MICWYPYLIYYGTMENIREKNDSILSENERDKILYDLFLRRGWCLDSSFLYKWKWAELYEQISKDSTYPFIDIEISCLEWLKKNEKFRKLLKKTEYITDVWSWDGQKAVALLWWTNWDGTYIAEDYSRHMLDIAESNIRKNAPEIKLWSSQKLNSWKHLSQQCKNNMYLFLWGTICNMDDIDIMDELKNMDNNGYIDWNYILLSYFTAPETQEEIDELIKIYNSDSNKAFHENGMDMLWLSKDDFEFDTVYEKDDPKQTKWPFPWKIKWIIRAKNDCIAKLGNGTEISVEKWKEFTIHYSRRFTNDWIEKLFNNSGCDVVFTVNEKWDSIALLKRKPRQLKTVKSIMRRALTWALIVGLTAWSIWKYNENRKQKDLDRAYTERESQKSVSTEWTFYQQETNELISALQLDSLGNEENEQAIIDLFNHYVWNHIDEWLTNPQLVKWFWDEYWWILVKRFKLSHSPYDFMKESTIINTQNIWKELSYTPWYAVKDKIGGSRHYIDYWITKSFTKGTPFEYVDWSQKYMIVKVKMDVWWWHESRVYFASKEIKEWYYQNFSTKLLDDISDKSWLDSEILLNNKKLQNSYEISNTNQVFSNNSIYSLIIMHQDKNKVVKMSTLNDAVIKPNIVYLWNWKIYYVINVQTESWEYIWLASDTIDWQYTTTTFNSITEAFANTQFLS